MDESGVALTGLQELAGSCYFFDDTGAVVSGWLTQEDGTRFFLESGEMALGWQLLDGNAYYFGEDGIKKLYWQEIDGKRYYFSEQKGMLSSWQELNGKQYFFGQDGAMITGWLEAGTDRYYFREDGSMAIGEVEIDGVSRFFTSQGKYVVMVNPWHMVPEDYEMELVDIEGFEFDITGRDALMQMLIDCREAGFRCSINNTYRSQAVQQYMWDDRIAKRMAEGMTREEAIAFTGQSLAKVGASEHHLGLAVDLDGSDAGLDWIGEHCWDYGFIVRYPEGKTDITGIIYEPWHFRYVGKELALELKELGLCMEEYMEMLTAQ